MGRVKELLLLQQQEEEQELWESYLEWVSSPEQKEVFSKLPKNIKDLLWEEDK